MPNFAAASLVSDGPMLEPPPALGAMPHAALPPSGFPAPGMPSTPLPPSLGAPGMPSTPLPPSLGAPLGTIPGDPGRLVPNAAPVLPAEPSSRVRR
jgi:hypothetical protein